MYEQSPIDSQNEHDSGYSRVATAAFLGVMAGSALGAFGHAQLTGGSEPIDSDSPTPAVGEPAADYAEDLGAALELDVVEYEARVQPATQAEVDRAADGGIFYLLFEGDSRVRFNDLESAALYFTSVSEQLNSDDVEDDLIKVWQKAQVDAFNHSPDQYSRGLKAIESLQAGEQTIDEFLVVLDGMDGPSRMYFTDEFDREVVDLAEILANDGKVIEAHALVGNFVHDGGTWDKGNGEYALSYPTLRAAEEAANQGDIGTARALAALLTDHGISGPYADNRIDQVIIRNAKTLAREGDFAGATALVEQVDDESYPTREDADDDVDSYIDRAAMSAASSGDIEEARRLAALIDDEEGRYTVSETNEDIDRYDPDAN